MPSPRRHSTGSRKARNDHFILKGRISVRRQCYPIQPGTAALYNKRKIAVLGTHGNETKALLPAKKDVSPKKAAIVYHAGAFV